MSHTSAISGPITHPALLLDALPDPIWVLLTPESVTFSNKAWLTYLGSDSLETSWLARVHPEDSPAAHSSWTASLDTRSPLRITCRLRDGNGKYRWFRVRGTPLPALEGVRQHVAWLFSAYDAHDDMVTARALRERLHVQTAMLDASIDCIKIIASDGSLIKMNKSGCLALGVPPNSDFGMDWVSLLPQDVRSGGREALDIARHGEIGRFPGRSELPGGRPRHWDNILTPILDTSGDPETILCLSRDVTIQRELEEQLRLSNLHLEATVDARTAELTQLWNTSLDLLLVILPNGTIVRANPAWCTILGYEVAALIGRHVNDFVAPRHHASVRELLESTATSARLPVEIQHRHRDGSVRWVAWVAARSGTEVYATGRHVTATKEAEEKLRVTQDALRHAQKVEAIGRLTGSVAHDFNNLLSVIRDSLLLFRSAGLPEERRARCLEVMTATTDRAIAVTRQLLDFARQSPLNPTVFGVTERVTALQDMLVMLCGNRIRVDFHVDEEQQYYVMADPNQFDTALVNLATNARDAMEGVGTLRISIQPTEFARDSWQRRNGHGNFVAVAIADSGHGITPEDVEHIFEPYFTTKAPGLGTGLGLSQVVGFAEQSGGTVGLESIPGIGATFTLYLPRAAKAERSA